MTSKSIERAISRWARVLDSGLQPHVSGVILAASGAAHRSPLTLEAIAESAERRLRKLRQTDDEGESNNAPPSEVNANHTQDKCEQQSEVHDDCGIQQEQRRPLSVIDHSIKALQAELVSSSGSAAPCTIGTFKLLKRAVRLLESNLSPRRSHQVLTGCRGDQALQGVDAEPAQTLCRLVSQHLAASSADGDASDPARPMWVLYNRLLALCIRNHDEGTDHLLVGDESYLLVEGLGIRAAFVEVVEKEAWFHFSQKHQRSTFDPSVVKSMLEFASSSFQHASERLLCLLDMPSASPDSQLEGERRKAATMGCQSLLLLQFIRVFSMLYNSQYAPAVSGESRSFLGRHAVDMCDWLAASSSSSSAAAALSSTDVKIVANGEAVCSAASSSRINQKRVEEETSAFKRLLVASVLQSKHIEAISAAVFASLRQKIRQQNLREEGGSDVFWRRQFLRKQQLATDFSSLSASCAIVLRCVSGAKRTVSRLLHCLSDPSPSAIFLGGKLPRMQRSRCCARVFVEGLIAPSLELLVDALEQQYDGEGDVAKIAQLIAKKMDEWVDEVDYEGCGGDDNSDERISAVQSIAGRLSELVLAKA